MSESPAMRIAQRAHRPIMKQPALLQQQSALALTIDLPTLEQLMRKYLAQQSVPADDVELLHQLTLSGFLVWLREKQQQR